MRPIFKLNHGCFVSVRALLLALSFVCASSASSRSEEPAAAILAAALEYLQNHIAMEILSRSKCGVEITAEQFGVPAFGTGVFLAEVSQRLSQTYTDQIYIFVQSSNYKATLQIITEGIYKKINPTRDRAR